MAAEGRIIRGDSWGAALRECLALPPAGTASWMAAHTRLLKSDTYSRVGLLQVRDQPCLFKLYLAKSAWQNVGFRLGRGRGVRSFDAALDLAGAGLPVPAARTCLLVPEGMALLSEGFPDGRNLRALWQGQPDRALAALLMQSAGQVLAALHRAGFVHGDCKWSNLLWSARQFYLVDLEAVRKRGRGPARLADDLARFTIDAEELGLGQDLYESFLNAYLAGSGMSREELIEHTLPAVEAIRARHLARYGLACQHLI